jgi:hypothetical protein
MEEAWRKGALPHAHSPRRRKMRDIKEEVRAGKLREDKTVRGR